MWLLGRVLPFQIGKYIPRKDKKWQNYLLLLKVCYIQYLRIKMERNSHKPHKNYEQD